MTVAGDYLSIRKFLEAVQQAGGYEEGIQDLCRRFGDRRGIQDVGYFYRAFLKRSPENSVIARRTFEGLESELRRVTSADEFKRNFGMFVFDEFPDLKRDLFIHIPKTGGHSVSLRAAQDPRFVVVRSLLAPIEDIADWGMYFYEISSKLFSGVSYMYVHYHLQLQDVIQFQLQRAHDYIYTIVREPVSLMVSYLNHVLTRVANAVGDATPPHGVADMRRAIGFKVDQPVGPDVDDSVLLKILDGYIPKNPICQCLSASEANDAFENVLRFGIRAYEIDALQNLFAERGWEPARENISRQYVTADTLSNRVLYQLHAVSYEDHKLYERLNAEGLLAKTAAPVAG
jgi:hypothetical protein